MNQVGIGHGRCRGQMGYFKMNLVEILPDSYVMKMDPGMRTTMRSHPGVNHHKNGSSNKNNHKVNGNCGAQSSVEELLTRIGLKEYASVFILNGYEDLELFRELEPADLDYLGILNVDHRGKLLTAVQLLHDMDCELNNHVNVSVIEVLILALPIFQLPITKSLDLVRRTTKAYAVVTKAQLRWWIRTLAHRHSADATFLVTRVAMKARHCRQPQLFHNNNNNNHCHILSHNSSSSRDWPVIRTVWTMW